MLDGVSWGRGDRLQAASSGRQPPVGREGMPRQPHSECCTACQEGRQEATLPASQHWMRTRLACRHFAGVDVGDYAAASQPRELC